MDELLYEFLRVVSILVGYKNSESLSRILTSVLQLMGTAYELSKDDISMLQVTVKKLFSIETYDEYKLISKVNTDDILSNANIYYEYLQAKNNYSNNLCYREFREILNEYSLEGDISCIRLKGILTHLGIIYNKNDNIAKNLLKVTAYVGDTISFKLLSFIDSAEKDYYNTMYQCLNDIYNGGVLSIDSLDCSEEIKEECEWILQNKRAITEDKQRKLLRYLFLSDNPIVKKIVDVVYGKYKRKEKIGF